MASHGDVSAPVCTARMNPAVILHATNAGDKGSSSRQPRCAEAPMTAISVSLIHAQKLFLIVDNAPLEVDAAGCNFAWAILFVVQLSGANSG